MVALTLLADDATKAVDTRRITEHDPALAALKNRTVRQLMHSVHQFVRELRAGVQPGQAQSHFIHRHIALMRAAYEAAHHEGQLDYYGTVSREPRKWATLSPDNATIARRMAFYAPSVAKMAYEAVQGLSEQSDTVRLAGGIGERADNLAKWQTNVGARLSLQADLTWSGGQDGYVAAGAADGANPFEKLYWDLEPVAQHCDQCPQMAGQSPYDPPGSGGNELNQTPGDGNTDCGAACRCSLRYAGALSGAATSATPAWAPEGMPAAPTQPVEPLEPLDKRLPLQPPESLTGDATTRWWTRRNDAIFSTWSARDGVAKRIASYEQRLQSLARTGSIDQAFADERLAAYRAQMERQVIDYEQLLEDDLHAYEASGAAGAARPYKSSFGWQDFFSRPPQIRSATGAALRAANSRAVDAQIKYQLAVNHDQVTPALIDETRAAMLDAARAQAAVDAELGGTGAVIVTGSAEDPLATLADLQPSLTQIFGHAPTRDEIARLVGAPRGAYVVLQVDGAVLDVEVLAPSGNPLTGDPGAYHSERVIAIPTTPTTPMPYGAANITQFNAAQKNALDMYRLAELQWNATRGNLPDLPNFFTLANPTVAGPRLPPWGSLTTEQQAALETAFEAFAQWQASVQTTDGGKENT